MSKSCNFYYKSCYLIEALHLTNVAIPSTEISSQNLVEISFFFHKKSCEIQFLFLQKLHVIPQVHLKQALRKIFYK